MHQWKSEFTHYQGRTVDLIFNFFCTDAKTETAHRMTEKALSL